MTALTPHRRPTAERCAELFHEPGQILPAEKPTLVGAPVPIPAPPPRRQRRTAVAALTLVAAGAVALALTRTTQPVDSAPPQEPPPITTTTSQTPAPAAPPAQVGVSTVVKTTTVHVRENKGQSKKTSKSND